MGQPPSVPATRFPCSSLARKAFGYDRDATEKLFEQLASSHERLLSENEKLRRELAEIEAQRAGFEEQRRLLSAQLAELGETRETLIAEARHDAEEVVRKAKKRAAEISAQAERDARALREQTLADTLREQARLEREIARLRALAADTHDRLSSFLVAALERRS